MKEKILFKNNIIILGYGSIARAVLPLIESHFDISKSHIRIFSENATHDNLIESLNYEIHECVLSKENYIEFLRQNVQEGDLLVNLTAEISSLDLIRYCNTNRILYLDTCIEMWPEDIDADSKTYDEREMLLELKKNTTSDSTTCLSSMGANPGIVSLLTKKLISLMAEKITVPLTQPHTQQQWAELAYSLGIQVIHINERDTQYTNDVIDPDTFISTWSVEAMIVESIESAEMSIGSHEPQLPNGAKYSGNKNKRDIYFNASGKDVQIRTWLPLAGEETGMILNHNEPFSIAELYTYKHTDGTESSPTVCFVYHPCDQTMQSLEYLTKDNYLTKKPILALHTIIDGHDELGVFIMTQNHGAFWYGSQLDIHTARKINPESSATSLQVAGGVIAGMCWIVQNINKGIIEPEEINDYQYLLDIAEPYWGGYVFQSSNWTPTSNKRLDFPSFLPDNLST